MEGRMKKYRQVSPERAKVRTEKSEKYRHSHHYNHHHHHQEQQQQHIHKVPVVYYLCRSRQLEHPHFMEVPLSSSNDLYLRDVIGRLNVLRGRGIASMYSWSCKRSYKNGYIWHDLCDDDIVHPAHGNEYILKGSELFEESNPGRFSPAGNFVMKTQKALPEPPSSRNKEESPSLSSSNGRTTKSCQDDELSPPLQHPCSSALSPESIVVKNSSWNGSSSLTECKVYKSDGCADASTQTEEEARRDFESQRTCTTGVSTDDGLSEPHQNQVSLVKQNPEMCRNEVPPPPSTPGAPSLSGRTDTLESLIRADVRKLKSFRMPEGEGSRIPSNTKLKVANIIMQLVSCGSISVEDHSFGLIPTYRPRFSNSKFPSQLFSTSLMLGKVDSMAEDPRLAGMRLKDIDYFSGSLAETSTVKEDAPTLRRSSPCNADRKSSEGPENSRTIEPDSSGGGSKRETETLSGEKQSRKPDSCRNQKENVIKIEESLLQEFGL